MNSKKVYFSCVNDLTCIEPLFQKLRARFTQLSKYSEGEFLAEPCVMFKFVVFSPSDHNELLKNIKKWVDLAAHKERSCIVLVHNDMNATYNTGMDDEWSTLNCKILYATFHTKYNTSGVGEPEQQELLNGEVLKSQIITLIENL